MRMPRLKLTGLLAAALACAATAGFAGCKKETSNDIVIGHVASLTGDTATFGVSAEEGIRLALDEINAKGGVLGKKVKVLTEDDQSKPDEAKTAASKLVTRDKVVAVLGEIASPRSIPMVPVVEDAKVPMLSPGSTNPKVTVDPDTGKVYDFVFRACFIDPFQGTAVANFALNDLKLKRFAVLYPVNSDYGVGLKDYFIEAVKKGGGEVVANESYMEKQDSDFRGQLTKIKGTNPEAIFVSGYYTEAGLIAKQARQLGITVPLMGGDGWDSDKTVTIGGDAVNGCYFSNHYSAEEDRPEVKAFVAAYKAKYNNKMPDAMAILGYDSMKLMADAIQRAGSTDGPKVRDALAATKGYPGASGAITIDKNHNAEKPIVILKIENGQFKYVSTVKPG